jgi:hypothetical protein
MATSNVDLLTQSYKVVRAKKRTKLGQAHAVVFDEDARRCAHIRRPFHYILKSRVHDDTADSSLGNF